MADIKKILTRVKDYVTQEDNLEKTRAENAEETLQNNIDAEEQARIAAINALDLAQVGSTGNYIKYVSQEDGQVAAQKQAFDTDMTNATDDNAPTTKNVKNYVDNAINNLDKVEVGEDGKYIKKIKEDNGIITATLKEFDTLIDNSADNTNTPTTKAVKDYVDSEIDKLDSSVGNNTKVITGLTITNGKITANTERTITSIIEGDVSNIPTDEAVKAYVDTNINELDLAQVGSDGNYIKFVSQEDGQVAAQKQAFDTIIDTTSNDTNAPTSKAVKDHVQAEINKLDVTSQGGNGKYIRSILEEDGKISATPQDFDTDFTNPSNNNAPTTQAVKNLIDSLDANQVGQNGHYIKTISEENGIITATKEAFETSIPISNPSEVLAPTVKAVRDCVDTETTRATNKETEITNGIGQYGDTSATQTVYGYLKAEEERAIAKETEINAKIPAQASASNQLADKAYVEDTVSTATAIFRGNFNLVSDLELNVDASHATISTVLGLHIATANKNDYCYVTIPTDVEHPLLIQQIDRYKHNNTNWEYEYTLNNSGYTTAQWNAINSGITTNLVTDLNTNTSKRHEHANKVLLDTYNQTESNLADAVIKKHNHENKALLDTYNQTNANLADAVTKKHEHANKNLLDSYDQTNADLTDAVSKKHNHSNQALLDTYTQTEADIAAAVTQKHIHSNKAILDATTASFTTALETYLTNTPLAVGYDTTNYLLYATTAAGNTTPIVGVSTLVHDAGLDDAEHTANRVTSIIGWAATADLSDAKYPTEKLVKASLDDKASLTDNNIFAGEAEFSDIATFDQEITVLGNIYAKDELEVDYSAHFHDDVTVDVDLEVDGDTTLNGNLQMNGDITVDSAHDIMINEDVTANITAETALSTVANLVWHQHKAYSAGDIIFYNKHLYICNNDISASSQGNTNPAADTINWTELFTSQA